MKLAVEILVLRFYCNRLCISLRDLFSSILLAVLVTYLYKSFNFMKKGILITQFRSKFLFKFESNFTQAFL